MLVLDAGCPVKVLQFTPDGRLLAGSGYPNGTYQPMPGPAFLDVWSLPGGTRTRLPLPRRKSWDEPGELAVSPDGKSAWLALGGRPLRLRLADGQSLGNDAPLAMSVSVVSDGSGTRQVLAYLGHRNTTLYGQVKGKPAWTLKPEQYCKLAGFLPDGDRFVTVDAGTVRTRSFAVKGAEVGVAQYRIASTSWPRLSPDGRYLATMGYGHMYVCDLSSPGVFGRIGGGSNYGDFRSFAFHPAGRTLAVIHGGPTLVKLYDLATLKLKHKLNWKLGALLSVAFSPDGTLAAAGSADGRIVVWDADE